MLANKYLNDLKRISGNLFVSQELTSSASFNLDNLKDSLPMRNFLLMFFLDLKPFIRHSKQNLALGMETEVSSTDNFDGCRHKQCLEKPAMSRFAVDGNFDSCFLSFTEQRPWFTLRLNRHHPIALIHVVREKPDEAEETMSVYIGKNLFLFNTVEKCIRTIKFCFYF